MHATTPRILIFFENNLFPTNNLRNDKLKQKSKDHTPTILFCFNMKYFEIGGNHGKSFFFSMIFLCVIFFQTEKNNAKICIFNYRIFNPQVK
jgi:hypothetical protein